MKPDPEKFTIDFPAEASVAERIQIVKEQEHRPEIQKFMLGYARRPDLCLKRSLEDYGPWSRLYAIIDDKQTPHTGLRRCYSTFTFRRKTIITRLLVPFVLLWGMFLSIVTGVNPLKAYYTLLRIDTLTDVEVFDWAVFGGKVPPKFMDKNEVIK